MNSPQPATIPQQRLRLVGQRSLAFVLVCLFGLWGHELFSDAAEPKGWKLFFILPLIVLGTAGTACLLIAWVAGLRNRPCK